MKNNDITNRGAFIVGFRFEDFLVQYKQEGVKDFLLNLMKGKLTRADVDTKVLNVMTHIYQDTDFNVAIVILNSTYTEEVKEYLEELPFGRVYNVEKEVDIARALLVGDLSYYVDNDSHRLSQMNSKYAVTLEDLNAHVPYRGNRV